jgi:hypothetical protein
MTPEERFLYMVARLWRDPSKIEIPDNLNWTRVAGLVVRNRMGPMFFHLHQKNAILDPVPANAREVIVANAERYRKRSERYQPALREYLRRSDAAGIPSVVLKGLSISLNIYGDPNMRPGGDIDLLVKKDQVDACIDLLEKMDIGAYWPNLMDDRFFARHHLHQQRSSRDLKTWFEIHWALDHPYTLLTIDYDALIARGHKETLLDEPVWELATPDLLLTLAVHLLKTSNYLPGVLTRPDLSRVVLADGMLMYFLDIVEVLRVRQDDLVWDDLIALAEETRTTTVFGSVLRVCQALYDVPVSDEVLSALPVSAGSKLTQWALNQVADQLIAEHLGEETQGFWGALLKQNGAFILRPVRMLEVLNYYFPPADFLQKRYGSANAFVFVVHTFRALGQSLRFAWDSIYFALERYFRLRRIGFSTSLSNRVEID